MLRRKWLNQPDSNLRDMMENMIIIDKIKKTVAKNHSMSR